jgi:DNA-binding NarL/FixJ family response regulator
MTEYAYIIGTRILQNELIAHLLKKTFGLSCTFITDFHAKVFSSTNGNDNSLILWDFFESNLNSTWFPRNLRLNTKKKTKLNTLFNVKRDPRIEAEALDRGIRGIFYENISTDLFVKGISAILDGDLWFSRETLIDYIFEENKTVKPSSIREELLTPRENDILMLLACGATNQHIANEECISPFTVKVHLQKIYRKIKVRNRIEAATWAFENI